MTVRDRELALWFLSGAVAGAAGTVVARALRPRRGLDPRLVRGSRDDPRLPTTIVLPGILGTQLLRPDGAQAWLNLGNALGHHDLSLPARLPLAESHDDLVPAGLIGVDAVLPRLAGFTEYADLLELLNDAGFRRDPPPRTRGAAFRVFGYDWRLDLVETARALDRYLDRLCEAHGDPGARFNLIGHSMGGLLARYYLRYGGAEPGGPVTWAGARRIHTVVLVATPSQGSVYALDVLLSGTPALLGPDLQDVAADLHDPDTWRRFGWGPFDTGSPQTATATEERRAFTAAALQRAREFHAALDREPAAPCPSRVVLAGGDCLPTLGRAILSRPEGRLRFEPESPAEAEAMLEAGDGRVTRASVLAEPGLRGGTGPSSIPEVDATFFSAADHHGVYRDSAFQSLLLRELLRPVPLTATR
jgi:pimeloyl-ACP methyl ester carboxylesterase